MSVCPILIVLVLACPRRNGQGKIEIYQGASHGEPTEKVRDQPMGGEEIERE